MNTLRTKITALLFRLLARFGVYSNVNYYTTAVQWSEPDRAYLATAPAFPSASAFAPTAHQALYELGIVIEMHQALYELGIVIEMLLDIADEDGELYPLDVQEHRA